LSDSDRRTARELSAQNAKMKFFDEIQQFGAHTGGHERAAIITGGFRKLVVLAAKAASKDTKIRGLLLSAGGNCHSISPEAERIMTQKTLGINDNS
jgi:hypothetical protein